MLWRKLTINSSVIKPKGEFQNACFKKTKHAKFSEKMHISYSLIRTRTCAYQGVRNVHFSENLVCFVFLKHPFGDSPFYLITDEVMFPKTVKYLHSKKEEKREPRIIFKDNPIRIKVYWLTKHQVSNISYQLSNYQL